MTQSTVEQSTLELKRLSPLTAKKLAKVTSGQWTYIFNRFAYGDWAAEIPTKLVTKDTAKIEDLALTEPEDARQLTGNRGFNSVIHQHCTREYKDLMVNITVNHSKKSKLSDLFKLERELFKDNPKLLLQVGRFFSDRVLGYKDIQGAGYVNLRNLDTLSKYLPYGNYNIALPLENKLNAICITGTGGTSEDVRAVIMPIRIGK